MSRHYNMSEKRRLADLIQTDWERRIKILTMKKSGMSYKDIALALGVTRQAVQDTYKKISTMSVERAEEIAKLIPG